MRKKTSILVIILLGVSAAALINLHSAAIKEYFSTFILYRQYLSESQQPIRTVVVKEAWNKCGTEIKTPAGKKIQMYGRVISEYEQYTLIETQEYTRRIYKSLHMLSLLAGFNIGGATGILTLTGGSIICVGVGGLIGTFALCYAYHIILEKNFKTFSKTIPDNVIYKPLRSYYETKLMEVYND